MSASPHVSVVVATYNRAEALRRCLSSLEQQTEPLADFEVVVVVDGSTDATATMLAQLQTPLTLRVYEQANAGAAAARNRGIDLARSGICLFLDDDMVAEPGLVSAHRRAQQASGGVVAVGRITCEVPPGADGFARYLADWFQAHDRHLATGRRRPTYRDCFSGNLSAPRAALREVGGFAVDLPRGEDVELGFRLTQAGLSVTYVPDAAARQVLDKDGAAIARDAEREGAASLLLAQRHPQMWPGLRLSAYPRMSPPRRGLLSLLARRPHPARPPARLGAWVERTRWSRGWYRLWHDVYYWRGVYAAARTGGEVRAGGSA